MYMIVKGLIDRLFSSILIILFSPILILLILINFFLNGSPIFFIQERSGKNMKKFNLIKLRTIKIDNEDLSKIHYTRLGIFFRKSGLDEVFQLFNILKGDLSFVGPRPLYTKYDNLYDREQIKRLSIKPGLTGLAQINQNNEITWEQKIKFDLLYVKNINFLLDIEIFFKTFHRIIKRTFDNKFLSISNEFKGNKK